MQTSINLKYKSVCFEISSYRNTAALILKIMREIKYRGLSGSSRWIYGTPVFYKSGEAAIFSEFERYGVEATNICETRTVVDLKTIGQYTGLKDKNGKEIYEGDIVKSKIHNPENYLVEFIEAGFCCTHPDVSPYTIDLNHFYPSTGCKIEVIGNIHEHPELLKT